MLGAALLLGSYVSAGTVVDLGIRSEGRTSFLSAPVADGFSNNLSVLGVTPSVRAAYQGQGLFLDGRYAPDLSLIAPSSDVFIVMNRFTGQLGYTPSPRLRLSADITGAIGDLDAGAAVRDLGQSRASALVGGGNLTQFPFADVIVGGDVAYRLTPRWTLNAGLRAEATGSPSPGADEQLLLPPQVRPEVNVGATWLFSATDSVTANLLARQAILGDEKGVLGKGGGYTGVTPSLAYNRTLQEGVVATTRTGWLFAVVDEGQQKNLLGHGLPVVDGRVQASVNLTGEAAIEGTLLFGVGPFSDPLGGLLEERVTTGVQGAWRVNRDVSLTTSVTAFGTIYAVGGNAAIAAESSTSVGGSFGGSWNLTEWISLNAEALGTSRVVADKFGRLTELRPELTVLVGITGAMNLFRDGERPAGTDPRPGRSVATRPVSLPGSAKAFSGKATLKDGASSTSKKGGKSSFGQARDRGDPKRSLDEDDVLDRRRRGVTVDERRLQKQRADDGKKALEKKKAASVKKAESQKAEEEKRNAAARSAADPDAADKSSTKKGAKAKAPAGKAGKSSSTSSSSSSSSKNP